MLQRGHKAAFTFHVGQDGVERDLRQGFKEGMIGSFAPFRRLERPCPIFPVLRDGDARVLTPGDPAIDGRELRFKRLFHRSEVRRNRLLEDGQVGRGKQLVAVRMPLVERNQVIVEAAEADALRADKIARFEGRTQGVIHIKLIPITEKLGRAIGRFGVKIAFKAHGQTLSRNGVGRHVGQGPPTGGEILEEVDGLKERTCGGTGLQRDRLEQGT